MEIFGVKPRPALFRAAADQSIETAENPNEEQRQLTLLAVGFYLPQALGEPGKRCFAHAQHCGEMLLRDPEEAGRPQHRPPKNSCAFRRRSSGPLLLKLPHFLWNN